MHFKILGWGLKRLLHPRNYATKKKIVHASRNGETIKVQYMYSNTLQCTEVVISKQMAKCKHLNETDP